MKEADEQPGTVVWLNDGFHSIVDARISPMDRGFLYGDGLFETMRAVDGKVFRLEQHVDRLCSGLASMRIELKEISARAWAPVVTALLMKNGLARGIASVKAVVSRGAVRGIGFPGAHRPTVLLLAEPYAPPSRDACRTGWRLHPISGVGLPALSRHKTLNYLRMLSARQEALDAGADEALLLDAEGSVIETAAGSVLALTKDGWVRPTHPGQLAGITVEAVTRLLVGRGLPVVPRRLLLSEFTAARAAWVLNSLMGIMPVRSVGAVRMPETAGDLAEQIGRELFAAP